MTDRAPCAHFVSTPDTQGIACLIGRNPALDCCVGCSGYLPDSERQACEIWARVMGYHRPVSAFNKGKRQEHADRRLFRERQNG